MFMSFINLKVLLMFLVGSLIVLSHTVELQVFTEIYYQCIMFCKNSYETGLQGIYLSIQLHKWLQNVLVLPWT